MQVSSDQGSAKENSTHIAGQSSIMKQQIANQKSQIPQQ
jgi:hypothetical protein